MDCLVYVDPSQRGEWVLALAALLPRDTPRASCCSRRRRTRPGTRGCSPGPGAPGGDGRRRLEAPGRPGPPSARSCDESRAHSLRPRGGAAGRPQRPAAHAEGLARGHGGAQRARLRARGASAPGARRPDPGRRVRWAARPRRWWPAAPAASRPRSAPSATFLHVASEVALPFERPGAAGRRHRAEAVRGRSAAPAACCGPRPRARGARGAGGRRGPRRGRARGPRPARRRAVPEPDRGTGGARTPPSGCSSPAPRSGLIVRGS